LNKKFINKKFLLIAAVILIIFLAMVYYIIASGTHYTSKDSNGNEIRFCISKDGKKCNELDFFNKKCSF